MHFVGKILIGLQLILSVLFMLLAGAVYHYHTTWQTRANTLQGQLQSTEQALNDLESTHQAYRNETDAKMKLEQDRADTFEAQATNLQMDLNDARAQLETTRTELENAQALATISAQEAEMRRNEAVALREINANLHQSLEQLVAENRTKNDKLFSVELLNQQYADRFENLQNEHALYQQVVRAHDIDVETYVGQTAPPPDISGFVLVTRERRNAPGLVQISLGSDDGLVRGHELFVYRATGNGKYLGKIRIDYLDYDKAVGTIVEKAKNGIIQRGDNVTTKL